MKPTLTETKTAWISGDQYAYSTSSRRAPRSHEMLRESSLKGRRQSWGEGGLKYHTGGFQLHISSERFGRLPFFSSTWLHWLICFHVESECLCTVSTFLHLSDGYSSAQNPFKLHPLRWKRFFKRKSLLFVDEKNLHVLEKWPVKGYLHPINIRSGHGIIWSQSIFPFSKILMMLKRP